MVASFLKNDMAALLNTSEFAVTAIYDTVVVKGIFDDEDIEVQMADGTVRIMPSCSFTGRSDDFTSVAQGDTLKIGTVTYTIQSWKDDGTGEIELFMEKR